MKLLFLSLLFLVSSCSLTDKNKASPLFISHSFKASKNDIFEMWISPRSFSKWLGPEDAVTSFLEVDVTEGGSLHWAIITPDGQVSYGLINYKEIKPPHSLAYTQIFTDKEGNFIKAPFSPTYPDEILTKVTLTDLDAVRTQVSVQWEIYGKASRVERRTFNELKPQMERAWQ